MNREHYGVDDPKSVLSSLSAMVESAVTGQVEPSIMKDGAVILDVFHSDSISLAEYYAPDTSHRDDVLHASYLADTKAAETCRTVLSTLRPNSAFLCRSARAL